MTRGPFDPLFARVTRRKQETHDVFTLTLELGREFHFEPGQFNMLYAPGLGDAAISISGDPTRPNELVHTIRALGRVTRELGALREGAQLALRGPFGKGWGITRAQAQDVVLVAGGLGLAPLRPAIFQLIRERDHYRSVALVIGAKNPAGLLFRDEYPVWREAGIEVIETVDQANSDWTGEVGVITPLLSELTFNPESAWVFTCGPEVMMRFCERELSRLGLVQKRFIVSLERSMKCGVGLCGHCQLGPYFLCKDGPVFDYAQIGPWLLTEGM